jgi:nitrate reductase NapE component
MKSKPTIAAIAAGAARWWIIWCVLFFTTFPLWRGAFVGTLRFVLEGLNNFGSGY